LRLFYSKYPFIEFYLIPLLPSPKREGGNENIFKMLSPSLLGEGFRER
jgi:hypothetical protein